MMKMRRPLFLDITPPPVEQESTTSFDIILEVVGESTKNYESPGK
jgi:hypothetical protein